MLDPADPLPLVGDALHLGHVNPGIDPGIAVVDLEGDVGVVAIGSLAMGKVDHPLGPAPEVLHELVTGIPADFLKRFRRDVCLQRSPGGISVGP